MMDIKLPDVNEPDIYSFGFDKGLYRNSLTLGGFLPGEDINSQFGVYEGGVASGDITSENIKIERKNIFIGKNSGVKNKGYWNTVVGYGAYENNTDGYYNVALGVLSLNNNTTGYANTALGTESLVRNNTGYQNLAVGTRSLQANTSGTINTAFGTYSLYSNTVGRANTAIGYASLFSNIDGDYNTALGFQSLADNTNGYSNIALGYYAGKYETGSDAFYVNNQDRTNTAGDKAKSLLYGVMAADPANQELTINANIFNSQIKSGSTQANAGAAANEIWKTASHASLPDNVLMIGV